MNPLNAKKVISNQVWSWGTGGLLLAMASGLLIFIADPARYAANHSFVTKMAVLTVAILFQFTFYRRAVRALPEAEHPWRLVILPVISLALWFTVGWAGRLIVFCGLIFVQRKAGGTTGKKRPRPAGGSR